MKVCGLCRYYIEGKPLLGSLWRGSVCMSAEPDPNRTLRVWRDKPLTPACWTSGKVNPEA